MSEHIRSIRVVVEIDTNKQTHRLDAEYDALDDIEPAVRDFLNSL